jgi:hypothetical protein
MHAACLASWVQEKGSLTCEVCKQQYKEQYVQALELAAAAEKAGHKESTGHAATADEEANGCSLQRLRFWFM